MIRHYFHSILIVGAIALMGCAQAAAQPTMSADALADSIGVNVHLHYTDTPYWKQFPLIRQRLVELGVRHLRDGLVEQGFDEFYDRVKSLASAGMSFTFITAPNQSAELWASYPERVNGALEAYEAPNELDQSRDPNWAETVTATLKRLRVLQADPRAAKYPIYGPSLTSEGAYDALGDVSALFDYANMHNYFAGRDPGTSGWGANGYGSIAWNIDLNRRHASGKPVVSTETGYHDGGTDGDNIPAAIAGRYMPRLLLEQFRAGVTRTFIYELCDSPGSAGYGLLDQDVAPKPAFVAVKNLIGLLKDPGPAFPVVDLRYSVDGSSSDLRHMAFQKRDGRYFIALWLSVPSWDPVARKPLGARSTQAVIRLPGDMRGVRRHQWRADGSVITSDTSARTSRLAVSVTDALTIVEIEP